MSNPGAIRDHLVVIMKQTKPYRLAAFTLTELLIVIGVIAVLMGILIPVLSKVRQSARTITCQSNLRQLGIAVTMYTTDSDSTLPFPSTSFGESALWFNAVDKYLKAIQGRKDATGVAQDRSYMRYKQCSFWTDLGDAKTEGAQDPIVEAARYLKMNANLRRNNLPVYRNPFSGTNTTNGFARLYDVKQPERFVMIGDGVSLDMVPNVNNQTESTGFLMEVNRLSEPNPGLRHNKGANIMFVDSHVELITDLKRIEKPLNNPHAATRVKSWEGEYRRTNQSGALVDPTNGETRNMAQLGLVRNDNMPLIWSDLGRLFR